MRMNRDFETNNSTKMEIELWDDTNTGWKSTIINTTSFEDAVDQIFNRIASLLNITLASGSIQDRAELLWGACPHNPARNILGWLMTSTEEGNIARVIGWAICAHTNVSFHRA